MYKLLIPLIMSFLLAGCDSAQFGDDRVTELETTDAVFIQVAKSAAAIGIRQVFSIDHSRLAEEAGEVLDASQVGFYTNPEVTSRFLANEIRAGLVYPIEYRPSTIRRVGVSHCIAEKVSVIA
jgi:hypothetical protein